MVCEWGFVLDNFKQDYLGSLNCHKMKCFLYKREFKQSIWTYAVTSHSPVVFVWVYSVNKTRAWCTWLKEKRYFMSKPFRSNILPKRKRQKCHHSYSRCVRLAPAWSFGHDGWPRQVQEPVKWNKLFETFLIVHTVLSKSMLCSGLFV